MWLQLPNVVPTVSIHGPAANAQFTSRVGGGSFCFLLGCEFLGGVLFVLGFFLGGF